jgi:acyl-CoA thioesterase
VSDASPVRATAESASRIVAHLMTRDAFSQWLGLEVLHADVGRSRVRCTVRADMVNGFGIAHGGVLFSLADSAFAFATNAGGTLSVALDCTVSFPAAVRVGDVLEAEAIEETTTNRFGFCRVTVTRGDDVVAHFRGTVYRTTTTHVLPEAASPSSSS